MANLSPILAAVKSTLDTAAGAVDVYFLNVPQDADAPFVRWEVVNTQEDKDLRVYGDPDHGEEVWINVNVWATSAASAMTIHDDLTNDLSDAVIVPTGWKPMRRPRREASQPLPDVESGLFRVWSRWSLRFCKP